LDRASGGSTLQQVLAIPLQTDFSGDHIAPILCILLLFLFREYHVGKLAQRLSLPSSIYNWPPNVSKYIAKFYFHAQLLSSNDYGCLDIPAVSPTPSHLSDLTASLPVQIGSGASTRKDGPTHSKRRQTLLSLLDALHELSLDDSMREFSKFTLINVLPIGSRLSSASFEWPAEF
jgi:hypothetical protein